MRLLLLLAACTPTALVRIDTSAVRSALDADAPLITLTCDDGTTAEWPVVDDAFEAQVPACGAARLSLLAKRAGVTAYSGEIRVSINRGVNVIDLPVSRMGEAVFEAPQPCQLTIDSQTSLALNEPFTLPMIVGTYRALCGDAKRDFEVQFASRTKVTLAPDGPPPPPGTIRGPVRVYENSYTVFDVATLFRPGAVLRWFAGTEALLACDDVLSCEIQIPPGGATLRVDADGVPVAGLSVQTVQQPSSLPSINAVGTPGPGPAAHSNGGNVTFVANGALVGEESLISTAPAVVAAIDETAGPGKCTLRFGAGACDANGSFQLTDEPQVGYDIVCGANTTLTADDPNLRLIHVVYEDSLPCGALLLQTPLAVDVIVDFPPGSGGMSWSTNASLTVRTEGHIALRAFDVTFSIITPDAGFDAPLLQTRPVVHLQAGAGKQARVSGGYWLRPTVEATGGGRFGFLVGGLNNEDARADALFEATMSLLADGGTDGAPPDLYVFGRRVFLPGLAEINVSGAAGTPPSLPAGVGGLVAFRAEGASTATGRETIALSDAGLSLILTGGADAGGGTGGDSGRVVLQTGLQGATGGEGSIAFAGKVRAEGGGSSLAAGHAQAQTVTVQQQCSGHCTAALHADVEAPGGAAALHISPLGDSNGGNGGQVSITHRFRPDAAAPGDSIAIIQPRTALTFTGGACTDISIGQSLDNARPGDGGGLSIDQSFPVLPSGHLPRRIVTLLGGTINARGGACESAFEANAGFFGGLGGLTAVVHQSADRAYLLLKRLTYDGNGGSVRASSATSLGGGSGGRLRYTPVGPAEVHIAQSLLSLEGGDATVDANAVNVDGGAGGDFRLLMSEGSVAVDTTSQLTLTGGSSEHLTMGSLMSMSSGSGGDVVVSLPTLQPWPAQFNPCMAMGALAGMLIYDNLNAPASSMGGMTGDCLTMVTPQ